MRQRDDDFAHLHKYSKDFDELEVMIHKLIEVVDRQTALLVCDTRQFVFLSFFYPMSLELFDWHHYGSTSTYSYVYLFLLHLPCMKAKHRRSCCTNSSMCSVDNLCCPWYLLPVRTVASLFCCWFVIFKWSVATPRHFAGFVHIRSRVFDARVHTHTLTHKALRWLSRGIQCILGPFHAHTLWFTLHTSLRAHLHTHVRHEGVAIYQ